MKLPKTLGSFSPLNITKNNSAFTLIEVIVVIGLFLIIISPIYLVYSNILNVIVKNQWRADAISIIENEIEMIRNMPYEQVGIQGSYPTGSLLAQKTVDYQGVLFILTTTVRNTDDPFDRLTGGNPNDTAPADYKLVELKAECLACPGLEDITMTTTVAPPALETATNNGSLFINVFDAYGKPIDEAKVQVINNAINPAITINDTTNINGVLQLVDIPTSTSAYEIKVSKKEYSSDQTYPLGAPANPNPVKPHATVAQQQVTSISFAIDKVSTLNLNTANEMCISIPNIQFHGQGEKLIGTNPDVLKYSLSGATDSNGLATLNNLEWDTYDFSIIDPAYDLSGYTQSSPIIINPGNIYQESWLVSPKNPSAFLVTVLDQNNIPINNASVKLTKNNFEQINFTGQRFLSETDWSNSRYSSQSGNIETENTPGQIELVATDGKYPTSTEWLISKTINFGTQNTTFYDIAWQPDNQPLETGPGSLRFQIATNNDNSTWNFIGPDGTAESFYTVTSTAIYASHNNNRYLRYKVYLKTLDENFSPQLDEIKIGFSSSCIPSGQAFINGLSTANYTLTVQKSGYQLFNDSNLLISGGWKEYKVQLLPL